MKNCLKCGYQRLATDVEPETECPQCGAIYAKVEAAIAAKLRQQAKHTAAASPELIANSGSKVGMQSDNAANASRAASSNTASAGSQPTKKMGLLPKSLLILVGLGFVSALLLPKLRGPVKSGPSPSQATPSGESTYESPGRKRIEADIARTRTEALRPEVLADQERFAIGALKALECVEGTSSCSTYHVEEYLKGLPKGWVEKALGPPISEQRLSAGHFYYWSFSLEEGGRKRSCRLQLEYGSVGECGPGVNGGDGACKFNFY